MKLKTREWEPMVYMAQEFLDQLFWKLNRILDHEGVSTLQWAFMQRALIHDGSVLFRVITRATGESKDSVRRAALQLQEAKVGKVTVNPVDRRERIFSLTIRGRRRTLHVADLFQAELLRSVGAREIFSKRAQRFTRHMWHASCYLESGDLADSGLKDDRTYTRALIADDSLRYIELPKRPRSLFTDPAADPEKIPF